MKLVFIFLMMVCSLMGEEVEIVSYNVRYAAKADVGERKWEQRVPQVVGFLEGRRAGIIGIQEALLGQLLDLEKSLMNYERVGVGRDDGKERGEFAPIFYDKRRWKAGESGTFWFSDTPEKAGSVGWGAKIPRICTWVRLLDKKGKGLYVFNAHWDHQSKESRIKSGKLLRERILGRKFKGDSVVVTGDFNCVYGSPGMKSLIGDGDFLNAHPLGFRTFHLWTGELKKGKAIDHILTSRAVKVLKADVVGNGKASDHHPVVFRVDL